jgi:predicted DNA-binding ribbon-helix-helix protein|tara:strand:- start:620 stop:916 length:297 start_codon:yes stop_codon:yes gene_type:complete
MINKNVTINGHRTSIRLEQIIWDTVDDICRSEDLTVNQLFTLIDNHRHDVSRKSAVRSFVVDYLRAMTSLNGAQRKDRALSMHSEKPASHQAAYWRRT